MPEVDHVHVLSSDVKDADLPHNVTIRQLKRGSALTRAMSVWWEVLRAGPFRQTFFLVVQGGPFPALLLPFKLMTGTPIYQWKAQPHVSSRMSFYASVCDNLVFTATEQSLLLDLPRKKRTIGHGIDTKRFRPASVPADRDFVTVGRVAPIKGIHIMIEAIAACREGYGVTPTLDIVGGVKSRGNVAYTDHLNARIEELGLRDHVRFTGHVPYADLPQLYPKYRASLNFSRTAFDKAVGESMACGVPSITTNPSVIESLPAHLAQHLATDADSSDLQAKAMFDAMTWNDATRTFIAMESRKFVEDHHSLDTFFVRMLDEIKRDMKLVPHDR